MPANFKPLLDRLLDRGFASVTGATIAAIVAGIQRGRMASMLDQLDTEAERLIADGDRFTLENAVLGGVLGELAAVAIRNRALVDGIAVRVQEQGIAAAITAARQMSLPGISDAALASVGVRWLKPDPAAIAQAIQFAESAAWDASLARYGTGIPQMVRDIAVRGIVAGRGPVAVARDVRRAVDTMPKHYAESLMRSLQLSSYRRGVALSYVSNRGIISHQIRISALDGRQCPSCTALHGTRLEVGEVVSDHRNGRCLLPGQRVRTARGLIAVEDVVVGDMVITHKSRYRRVINTFNRDYSGDVYALTSDGHTVTVTPEHPVFTQRGWVEAAALTASDTLLTFVSINRRVSKRRIVHPFARNLSSRMPSRVARSLAVCHLGSVSTPSIKSGKAKSILYVSTANCGEGNSPASFNAAKNSISCADMKSGQRSWRVRAALIADSGVRPLIRLVMKLGSFAICRVTASLPEIGVIPDRFISLISGRTLIPSSAVNSRYVACSSTYRRLRNDPIDSPIRASSRRIHASDFVAPAGTAMPRITRRLSTPILDRLGKNSAISAEVCVADIDLTIASSSSVQGNAPTVTSSPKNIATIIQHPLYTGKVYDLEIEEDHSFFAEGIAVHNCTSIAVIRGLERLAEVETGVDWFARQPDDVKRGIVGPTALEAMNAGRVQLRDFVVRTEDPLFGESLAVASLQSLGLR